MMNSQTGSLPTYYLTRQYHLWLIVFYNVYSLRNNMFELADRLVGIYKTNNCTKSITIDPGSFSVCDKVAWHFPFGSDNMYCIIYVEKRQFVFFCNFVVYLFTSCIYDGSLMYVLYVKIAMNIDFHSGLS